MKYHFNHNTNCYQTGLFYHIKEYLYISNSFGGEHQDNINDVKTNKKIVIKGYTKPITIGKNITNPGKYFGEYLSVQYTKGKEKNRIYGIYIKELSEEFEQRCKNFIKWCCDYCIKNKYQRWEQNKPTFPYDVISKTMDFPLIDDTLDTYNNEDRKAILENSLERLNHRIERGW